MTWRTSDEAQTAGILLRGGGGEKHLRRGARAARGAAADLAPDRAARGRARRTALPARQQGHVPHRRGTKPVSADAADLSGHPPRGGQRAQRGDGHERAHQARRHLLGDVVRVTLYK